MSKTPNLVVARPKRPPGVLVCAKCVRKFEDGRDIAKALKSQSAARAEAAGRRPGKLLMTKCMSLCPKRALAVASGATLARGEVLVLRAAGDVSAALDRLCPDGPPA